MGFLYTRLCKLINLNFIKALPVSKRRGSTKLLNRGKAQLKGTEHTLLTQQRLILK